MQTLARIARGGEVTVCVMMARQSALPRPPRLIELGVWGDCTAPGIVAGGDR